ncbi:exodeoxyribonuclease VII small subunit [candidate division WWE3 bacterium CG10_big_fil_rev_8_21_14_0_10_32_10]|uniref:Exodeoxyribonuclease VII small subunit n=1 Tax=candidate division WWE3 bacterium CG10_big_fil_rev_8_21_14_0_10_32_10 TaxID=1975090 RepID=A0A2H0RBM2_UNCKA|nr:MAG: exodeoxyribonuclease VII small subunit [candidate division WWE3 bacterium CG10_big_fil_rev_8_21_14_0_10_32_10]
MKKNKDNNIKFSDSIEELEEINAWFQSDNINLEEGIEKIKRGRELIKKCKSRIKEVENEFVEIEKEEK